MYTAKLILRLLFIAGAMSAVAEGTNVLQSAESAEAKAREDRIMELLNSGSDPFSFQKGSGVSGSASSVNMAQMDVTKLSASINVKGILILEGEEPQAMIKIGSGVIQLVRKDDLIMMPVSNSARKHGKGVIPAGRVKYLLVKSISRECIVVAPEERPQELIKIR